MDSKEKKQEKKQYKNKDKDQNKKFKLIIIILICLIIIMGVSYALFSKVFVGDLNKIKTGTISFVYDELSNGITITDPESVEDNEAIQSDNYFQFSVNASVTGKTTLGYLIYYTLDDTSTINSSDIKMSLSKISSPSAAINTEQVLFTKTANNTTPFDINTLNYSASSNNYELYNNSFVFTTDFNRQYHYYRFRMWPNFDSFSETTTNTETVHEISKASGTFKVKINVLGKDGVVPDIVNPILKNKILAQGVVDSGSGLYSSTATNSEQPTYYYKGDVTNNYIDLYGLEFRIIRINEDGSIRIIYNSLPNDYVYNSNDGIIYDGFHYMYYSNSDVKPILENWFDTELGGPTGTQGSKIIQGTYCEQAKVAKMANSYMPATNAYTPNFQCETDINGYGTINSYVGLITYDEAILSLTPSGLTNESYLINGENYWTMSPSGYNFVKFVPWYFSNNGTINQQDYNEIYTGLKLRPVVNLNANVTASTGTGSESDPFIID